ncbi:hypothetical protein BY458DRAFT_440895 [Sporodiniella umbellata]|nr:hypothetical protein BY458DRAFT_440895 [Sporodiniella umbellata]
MIESLSTTSTFINCTGLGQHLSKKGSHVFEDDSQRSSWQTFITCKTTKTEDPKEEAKETDVEAQKRSIYKAQLANPLVTYS